MILLIIIGIILVIVGFFLKANVNPYSKYSGTIRIIGFLVIGLGVFSSMFKQIGAGKVGVKSLYGNVEPDVLQSGLHIINPLLDVTVFDIQTQNYTMSAIHNEGSKAGDDAIRVLSNDGLEVVIDLTVLYRVVPGDAPKILKGIGEEYTDMNGNSLNIDHFSKINFTGEYAYKVNDPSSALSAKALQDVWKVV
ncbi:MAG: SPFH domain-containing protein [Flavobacterium sp.]